MGFKGMKMSRIPIAKFKAAASVLSFFLSISLFSTGLIAEPENQELRQQVLKLQDKIDAMEKQRIKDKVEERKKELKKQRESGKTKIEGFFTFGAVKTDHEPDFVLPEDDITVGNSVNFRLDTVAGIQLRHRFNQKISYTHQLLYRASDIERNLKTEWAYIAYKINPELQIKVGRLRRPLFMLSESLEVGFSYPWVRPPVEIYRVPNTGLEGVDLLYDFQIGEFYGQLQLGWGDGVDEVGANLSAIYESKNNLTTAMTVNRYPFSFRIGVVQNKLKVSPYGDDPDSLYQVAINALEAFNVSHLVNLDNADSTYANMGFRFDNGKHLVLFEYTYFEVERFPNSLGPGGYLLYGYRLGKWLPFLTYGQMGEHSGNQKLADEVAAAVAENVGPGIAIIAREEVLSRINNPFKSYTLGINYFLNTNVRLKADAVHFEDFENGSGSFVEPPDSHNAVYSIAVDLVY